MAYVCDLGSGRRAYLDNQGTQTLVTIASSSPGQQQQSSSSFPTGDWTSAPEAYLMAAGVVLKITTATGDRFIQIQGSSMGIVSAVSVANARSIPLQQTSSAPPNMEPLPGLEAMQPMKPIEPMKPMQMGDMQMGLNPMEMRMGDMEMRMGTASGTSETAHRFCSQCGSTVQPDARFCSSCGHQLV